MEARSGRINARGLVPGLTHCSDADDPLSVGRERHLPEGVGKPPVAAAARRHGVEAVVG
jgi:hypothetical protein